jgi:hypothetical protein
MVPGIGLWHLPFYCKSLPWVTYFDRYNSLVGNALEGGCEVDRLFAVSVCEASVLLARRQYAYAASAVKALENYMRGWEHYRERAFPAFLKEIKAFINSYVPVDTSPQSIAKCKANADLLETRISAARARYPALAAKLQADFIRMMPQVYSKKAWAGYFVNGSMKELE